MKDKGMANVVDLLVICEQQDTDVTRITASLEQLGRTTQVVAPLSANLVHVKANDTGTKFIEIDERRIDRARVIWHPEKFSEQGLKKRNENFHDFPISDTWTQFCTDTCYELAERHLNDTIDPTHTWKEETSMMVAEQVGFYLPTARISNIRPFQTQNTKEGNKSISTITENDEDTFLQNVEHVFGNKKYGIFERAPKNFYRVLIISDDYFLFSTTNDNVLPQSEETLNLVQDNSLPEGIQERLSNFLKAMNLDYATIDIVEDVEGDFWYIKCYPDHVWSWINESNREIIAESFISYFQKILTTH